MLLSTLPTFPETVPLQIAHSDLIARYLANYPPYCDYTFITLWCWNLKDQVRLADLNGNLVIRFQDYLDGTLFYSFLGQRQLNDTLTQLFEQVNTDHVGLPYLKLIPHHNFLNLDHSQPNDSHDQLQKIELTGYTITVDPDNHDYIYALTEIANLVGNKYRAIRNQVNQFERCYPHWQLKILDLTDANTWQQLELFNQTWKQHQQEKANDVSHNLAALRRIRAILDQVPPLTIGLYLDGILRAYSINELNSHGYVTCIFEHTDTHYDGIGPWLIRHSAQLLLNKGYQYWNWQQDLGFAGLRSSKQSYRPWCYLKKYIIAKLN